MPFYKCVLARTYLVEVEANNSEDADEAAESFVGYFDESTEIFRKKYQFEIHSIEMVMNEVFEVEIVEPNGSS